MSIKVTFDRILGRLREGDQGNGTGVVWLPISGGPASPSDFTDDFTDDFA